MVQKRLIIIISISSVIVLSFFVWHFIISIYEVRYVYDFHPNELSVNSEYCIDIVGINSLGWEIKYRNLDINFEIELGKENIEIFEYQNKICFLTKNPGDFSILLFPVYSLNPTLIKGKIINK